MNSERLVAEVRYGASPHVHATKIGATYWFRVRLGKKRMLHCDCGAGMRYLPNALIYDAAWGGCAHLVALFKGNVTSDEREAAAGDYTVSRPLYYPRREPTFFVRLTKLGEAMFFHIWVALKL